MGSGTNVPEKLLILVFCLLTLLLHPVTGGFILSLFLSLAVSFASQLSESKKISALIQLTWPVMCLILPEGWYFLPLNSYDVTRTSLWWLYAPSAAIVLWRGHDDVPQLFFILTGMVLAGVLAQKNTALENLSGKMRRNRDETTAQSLSLARANKELREHQDAEIYAATMKERNRIAREIHDNVGHILSRSILMIGALKTVYPDSTLQEPLDQIESSLQTAMNSIRTSVHDLHDDSIDLKTSAESLLRDFNFCRTEFHYDMGMLLPRDVKYAFLTILKEALSNTIRHSNATLLTVSMQEHPGMYQIVIQDNGTVYRQKRDRTDISGDEQEESSGIGLENIRERVRQLGGTVRFSHENGFRIFAMIPRTQKESQEEELLNENRENSHASSSN